MDGRWHYYSKYWTNTQQKNGFRGTFVSVFLHLYPCWCGTVERVLICTLPETLSFKLFKWRSRHSPLLDQKDGYQHQQYEDEHPSADPSDLHHPVGLFSRVRDDFRLLCSTYGMTINYHPNCGPGIPSIQMTRILLLLCLTITIKVILCLSRMLTRDFLKEVKKNPKQFLSFHITHFDILYPQWA